MNAKYWHIDPVKRFVKKDFFKCKKYNKLYVFFLFPGVEK